jgi:CheY-like chemotaxis protein
MSHIPKPEQLHVLLVDDDEDDRYFFREVALEILHDALIKTFNGHSGLTQYLAKCDGNLPDVIFLDINMPEKDGIEVLGDLKNDAKYKNIAVAMYTTSSDGETIEKARSLGANVYICKPNSISALKKILRKVFDGDWKKPADGENFVRGENGRDTV